jgi:hypothetical protein
MMKEKGKESEPENIDDEIKGKVERTKQRVIKVWPFSSFHIWGS